MINSGQYVKIIFKNSTQVEGLVESWSDTKVVLKSEDGKNLLIIMNISEDALAIKINLDHAVPVKIENLEEELEELEEEFQATYDKSSADELRNKDLAKLRSTMIEQEKKIISEKLKEHVPSNMQGFIKYGNPFFKK